MQRKEKVIEEGELVITKQLELSKVKVLGEGQFGRVSLFVDKTGRKHAVKICVKPARNSGQEYMNDYLMRELELHKKLKHKYIVELYNGISLPDCTILDMEFCDKSLTEFLVEQGGTLQEPVLKMVAAQCTIAIDFLHSKGVVHRDIKPDNILMCFNPDGSFECKIADFGFAKKEQDALQTTLGSPIYEAPEVRRSKSRMKYTNRCDMWSLGIMYYQLGTGDFPFPQNSEGIRRALTNKDLVCFELPASANFSECCRHFIKNHLYKKPGNRYSHSEALNHPFVMSTARILPVAKHLKVEDFTSKRLVHNVDVGNLIFEKAKQSLGAKIQEPHSLGEGESRMSVLWSDVIKSLPEECQEGLDDVCVISNGGSLFKVSDSVPLSTSNDYDALMVLLVPGAHGIEMDPLTVKHHNSVSEETLRKLDSMKKSELECLNGYIKMIGSYFKNCSGLIKMNDTLYDNCVDVEVFRANVIRFDRMVGEIYSLQQAVVKKFKDFPKVAFIPPLMEPCRNIVYNPFDTSTMQTIRGELKNYRNQAQKKVDSGRMDVSEEVGEIAKTWDRMKDFESKYQKGVDDSCSSMRVVMKSFCVECEVLSRLFRYLRLLEKASTAGDAATLYPELRTLLDCDYLNVSSEARRALMGRDVSKASTTPVDDKDKYIAELKSDVEMLQGMVEELKKERDNLERENKKVRDKTKETLDSLNSIIDCLRAKLKENGIADPTMKPPKK